MSTSASDHCPASGVSCNLQSGLGGLGSVAIAYGLCTPFDLVRCNAQVYPLLFGRQGQLAFHRISSKGFRPLFTGGSTNAIGQALHAYTGFAIYGYCKSQLTDRGFGRNSASICASVSAEFLSTTLLCAFEATKIRIQTTLHIHTMRSAFASGLLDGTPKIVHREGVYGLFKGIVPLWARQVPFGIIRFWCFDRALSWLGDSSGWRRYMMCLGCGGAAGVVGAIVSQPGDVAFTLLNTKRSATLRSVAADFTYSKLCLGLQPRILLLATATAIQLFLYDSFTSYLKLHCGEIHDDQQTDDVSAIN